MTKLTQTSWLGGQMDVRMTGRQDMANYRNGASVLKNFVPVKLGSIRKRPGTDFVADLTDWVGGHDFRMIPFGFLGGVGFVLILCPEATPKARAYTADGSHVDVTGNIPYAKGEIGEIGYVQCGDIVFLAHRNHPPAEIRHDIVNDDEHAFDFSDIAFNPVRTVPTLGAPAMERQYFDAFTFTTEDQKLLDTCMSHYDPETWNSGNKWYDKYHEVYDNKQKPSGKTKATYRASVVLDGSEGPLTESKSTNPFASPWTESQTVSVKVSVTIPEGTSEWELRLYKEVGGVWGLVGAYKSNGSDFISHKFAADVVSGRDERPNPYYAVRVYADGALKEEVSPTVSQTWKGGSLKSTCNVKCKTYRGAATVRLELVRTLDGETVTVDAYEYSPSPVVAHTFVDDNIAPDSSVTPIDTTGGTPFAMDGDYPGCVGLYQQRLIWAGTKNDPARIWMSRAGDFYEYRPHDRLQLDDAIDFILPITQFTNINFIVELGRLFAFAECTELVIGSASDNQGVSYETIMATEHSHLGCTKRLPPIVANNTLLFVNRTGQSVRDYDEKLGSSRFGGTDVSVFAAGIFADNPIVDWTWQQEPNSTVWCVLKDGQLASFTYDKEQEIGAWAVHELGGGGKAIGIAKTCAVFGRDAAHPTTGEVMVVVERGAGEARRVTLERMRPWGAADGSEADLLCMDCCTDDASKSVAGMTVVNIDGVSHFGYRFESVMTTMPPAIGSEGGASQFDVKLGQHAHLRTVGSRGGEIYAVGMRNQPSKIDEGTVRDGEDDAEFRDVDVVLAGSNNRDGRVTVRHDEPWPFQLALLELDYETEN